MDKSKSLMLASAAFGIVAILHLIRAILSLPMTIGNFDVPSYFSYIAAVFLGYLSWHMLNVSKK